MSKLMYFLLILLFSMSPQTYGQTEKLACAKPKKEEPKSCGLKSTFEISDIFSKVSEKCEETATENLDEQYELIGSFSIRNNIELTQHLVRQSISSLQMTIDYYEKNLTNLEKKVEPIPPEALIEINNLSKAIAEYEEKNKEIINKFENEEDYVTKQQYTQEHTKNSQEKNMLMNKKYQIETSLGIQKKFGAISVEDKFKPQTIEYLKQTLPKLKTYKEKLEKGLAQNDLVNPNLIKDYKKALGINIFESFNQRLVAKGATTDPCGLSSFEYFMVNRYTSNSYAEINSALRNGPTDKFYESAKKQADIINRALDKIASYKGLVQRGARRLPFDVEKAHCLGCVVEHQAFTSTSTGKAFTGNHQFVIISRNGKYVAPISDHPKEQEVLFKSGARFKVLAIEKKDAVTQYIMQEVEE